MQRVNLISNSTKDLYSSDEEIRKEIRKEYSSKVKKFKSDIYNEIFQLNQQKHQLYEEKTNLQKKVYELEEKIKEYEIEKFIESDSKWSETPIASTPIRGQRGEKEIDFNVPINMKDFERDIAVKTLNDTNPLQKQENR